VRLEIQSPTRGGIREVETAIGDQPAGLALVFSELFGVDEGGELHGSHIL
jgi:hypothetical protein